MQALPRRLIWRFLWGAVQRRYRAENPLVIAVSGSVGKTSTKEAIGHILASDRPVEVSRGNLATNTGLAVSLLGGTEQATRVRTQLWLIWRALTGRWRKPSVQPTWVLEYSGDSPGDLPWLCAQIKPDYIVLTSGGPVHLELYGSQEAIDAEHRAFAAVVTKEYRFWNGEDPFLEKLSLGGTGYNAVMQKHSEGWLFQPTGYQASVVAKLVGKQHVLALVAALAVARALGVPESKALQAAATFEPPAGRGRVISGIKNRTLIDETANSSPEAVIAGVQALRPFAGSRHVAAVLGNMNELGAFAAKLHREVGVALRGHVDQAILVGPNAEHMATGAREAGVSSIEVFRTADEAREQLDGLIPEGAVVYLKASQNGMRFERFVFDLMRDQASAPELLVRMSPAWKKR